jgi:hypothetical protein
MKQVFAAILGLVLMGCSPAVPLLVWEPDAEPTPESRPASEIMNERAVTPRFGAGAIMVTSQEKDRLADGCTFDVVLDEQLVAGLRPGEQVVIFAEPGQRVLSFSVRDEASCRSASADVALEVVAHTTQKIHLGSGTHYELKVEVDSYGRSLPP